jgi:hypothetical protein
LGKSIARQFWRLLERFPRMFIEICCTSLGMYSNRKKNQVRMLCYDILQEIMGYIKKNSTLFIEICCTSLGIYSNRKKN